MTRAWVIATLVVSLAYTRVYGEFLLPEDTKFNDAPSARGDLGSEDNGYGNNDDPFLTFDWGFGDDDDDTEDDYGDDDDDNQQDVDDDEFDDEIEVDEFEEDSDADNYEDPDETDNLDETQEFEDGTEEFEELENKIEEKEEQDEYTMNRQWLRHLKTMRENNGRWRRMMRRALHGQVNINPYLNVNWDLRFLTEKDKWWNGPNVCKRTEEEEDEIERDATILRHHIISSSVCDDTGTVYKCTTERLDENLMLCAECPKYWMSVLRVKLLNKKKKMSVIYECCHGFQREDNKYGCTKALPIRTLLETLDDLKASDMLEAVDGISLTEFLNSGNFTIFAPKEGLFGQYKSVQPNVVIVTPDLIEVAKELEETVVAHIVQGHVKTTYIEDEQLLPTLSEGNNIRMNIYERPKRLVTANCRPIISSDNLATNGVVHLVDGMLTPVKESIASIVSKNSDLSMFKTVLGQSGLLSMLKKDGQYTLMAPSNSAFNRMNPDIKKKLLSGEQCVKDVIRHHLLQNVLCSSILDGHVQTLNSLNRYLNVTRSEEGKLFVEHAQVLDTDIMATNGVIHIIDDVLIPDEALTLLQVVEKMETNIFLNLVSDAGLSKTFTQLHNYTIFMPTAEAFDNLPEQQRELLLNDTKMLADTLLYHVLPSAENAADLEDRTSYNTLLHGSDVNVRHFKNFPFGLRSRKTVQCAVIEEADAGLCGGVIHMVDRVMIPPSGNVFDLLQDRPEFSELVKLMKATGVAETLHQQGPYTVFAPTNIAIRSLGEETMKFLGEHPDKLKELLLHHIIKEVVCCSGVFNDILSETRTTLDDSVVLTNRQGDRVVVNQVPITQCDIMASNGVVQVIDKVLPEAVNRYVTRHLSHNNGHLEWHLHYGGDNFGRGLEAYVQNLLDRWFGPKRPMRRGEPNMNGMFNEVSPPIINNQDPAAGRGGVPGMKRNLRNLQDMRRRLQHGQYRPGSMSVHSPHPPSAQRHQNARWFQNDDKPQGGWHVHDSNGPNNFWRHRSTSDVSRTPRRRHVGIRDPGLVQRKLQHIKNRRNAQSNPNKGD